MAEKKKDPITPVAPCKWAFLSKPKTKYDPNGKYEVDLVFDMNCQFIKHLEAAFNRDLEATKKAMKPAQAKNLKVHNPIKPDVDKDGEDTGFVTVKFTTYAYKKDKKTGAITPIKLKAFDAAGKAMSEIPIIGNGSKLSVQFRPKSRVTNSTFYYTLYLNAFQLVELVEYERDGSSYGFGNHEGGYESDDNGGFGGDAGGDAGGYEDGDPGPDLPEDDLPF